MNPLVSVIIPTYNRCEDLKKAIESAQSQTYNKLEIVICDDCSTDDTLQVVNNYLLNDARIKYFRNPVNLKFAGNHKKAIEEYAKGDYCMILGDDDYLINSQFLEIAVQYIIDHNLVIVGSNYQIFDSINNIHKDTNIKMDSMFDGVKYLNNRLIKRGWSLFIGASVFDRKKATRTEPFTFETPAADGEFIDKLVLLGNCGFLNIQSICYRVHGTNWSSKAYYEWNNVVKLYKIAERVEQFAEQININKQKISSYSTLLKQSISINYLDNQFDDRPEKFTRIISSAYKINSITPLNINLLYRIVLFYSRKLFIVFRFKYLF